MKKIMLAVITLSMLLTNVAFASTKTDKNSPVPSGNQTNVCHLDTQDPL